MQVPVSIKGELEVHIKDLPPTALDLIKSALSFTNEDKESAKREQVAGWWSMPDTIDLWRVEHRRGGDQVLVMPRGFAAGLGKGLQNLGTTIDWTDNRLGPRATPGYFRPFVLRDYQLEAAIDMARAEQGFFECPAGGGKGHPVNTEVPTPEGFRLWGSLEVGDEVLGSSGDPVKVTNIFDRGQLPTWEVKFSDGTSVLCDGDHLWQVSDRTKRRRSGENRILSVDDLRRYGLECNEGWRWKIPLSSAQHRELRPLPLDPYTVGALIANGGLTGPGTTLSTPDPEVAQIIAVSHAIKKIRDADESICDRYSLPGLTQATHDLGLRVPSRAKRIPSLYLFASRKHRISLLQGLMDGDGSSREGRRSATYHTTSEGLAADVVQLVCSLGGTASIERKDRTHEGKPVEYDVNINPSHSHLWGTSRKRPQAEPRNARPPIRSIVGIEYAGHYDIRCITVDAPDSLYMISRNYVVTHNTVTLLGLAAHLQLKTLVIVDKADLVEQWREEAFDFLKLGFDPEGRDDLEPETIERLNELVAAGQSTGKIGQNTWDEKDLTIALRQTLWKRIDELDPTRWWDQWGLTIYDEGHHIAADTLGEIVRRCISRHSIGASATPAKTVTKGLIVEALIGPIVHRTSREVLRKKGILILPSVVQLPTEFTTTFWPTHNVEVGQSCMVEGCPKDGKKHQHRNNYSSALRKLVESKERNKKIAKKIVSEPNRIHLVPSRQKKHLDLLKKAIVDAGWEGGLFFLRGEENARGESRKIVREIRSREHPGSVILSTVAEEALNIPPIDRVHVVFPIRQDGSLEQLVGRGERSTEGKDGCIVYDWVDDAEVFQGQAYARDNFYRRQGYPVDGSFLRNPPVDNLPS